MNVKVEMFRNDEWKEVGAPPDIQVEASIDSGPTLTINHGYIQPPWRVVIDDKIWFERTR